MPGTIIRAPRDRNHPYVIMSRSIADNRALSIEARGTLFVILSKPDNWHVNALALAHECNCGQVRMTTILKELERNGYLTRQRGQDENGRWVWRSEVTEQPVMTPTADGAAIDGETIIRQSTYGSHGDIVNTEIASKDNANALSASDDASEPLESEQPTLLPPAEKPKRERKPRTRTAWDDQKTELSRTFEHEAHIGYDGLTLPVMQRRWWSPLRAILAAANGDVERAKQLIGLAVERCRKQELTLSSPQSIEQVAIALSATTKPKGDGNAGTWREQEQRWEAW